MIHNGSELQRQVCKNNNHSVIICSDVEQRQRILYTLKNLNVPIYDGTSSKSDEILWPNLAIVNGMICGHIGFNFNKSYIEMTEYGFINLFVNKFDIYGNVIINE